MTELERMMCLILSLGEVLLKKEDILSWPADKQLEFTAEYLLANGVILPPCKIGDEVYRVIKRCGEWQILPCIVKGITHRGGEWWDVVTAGPDGMLGSNVFLTREEAEEEIQRRMRDENENT